MKFSFESQEYRDDLAHELMATPKEERKETLDEKRDTLKFVLAKHIHEFTRKNEGGSVVQDEAADDVPEPRPEKIIEKEVVGTEKGFDEVFEYRAQLEIIDISDQIPESVRIIYDMNRLLEIEASFPDDEVSRGWLNAKSDENDPRSRTKETYINRDSFDSAADIVKKYIKLAQKEKGKPLTKDDGTIIDDAELKAIAEQAKKDFAEFRERITGGLASNPDVFYHTIGAHTEGFNYDWYASPIYDETKEKLRNRFPNKSGGAEIKEDPLEIDGNLHSDGLWVNSKQLIYDNMLKPLMLIDATSMKFRKYVRSFSGIKLKNGEKFMHFYGHSRYDIDEVLDLANTDSAHGAKMEGGSGDFHWLRVAEQIFDPYHGRLIKIKNVETDDKSDDDEDKYFEDLSGVK